MRTFCKYNYLRRCCDLLQGRTATALNCQNASFVLLRSDEMQLLEKQVKLGILLCVLNKHRVSSVQMCIPGGGVKVESEAISCITY